MAPADGAMSIRWYRSFYFRIGFSFVVFVVGLLVAQSLIFNVILTRPPFRVRSPNNLVAVVAANVGAALTHDATLDLGAYLDRTYPGLQPIHVLMKSGETAANRKEYRRYSRSVEAVLAGRDLKTASSRRSHRL
jgi:hypothetical protein